MAQTDDLLTRQRRELDARIKELQPLVGEYDRLKAAFDALDTVGSEAAPAQRKSRTTTPAPTPKSTSRKASSGKRGRPKGSGGRKGQMLSAIASNPGLTVADATDKMGIKPAYGYRLQKDLLADGAITRDDDGRMTAVLEPAGEPVSEAGQETLLEPGIEDGQEAAEEPEEPEAEPGVADAEDVPEEAAEEPSGVLEEPVEEPVA